MRLNEIILPDCDHLVICPLDHCLYCGKTEGHCPQISKQAGSVSTGETCPVDQELIAEFFRDEQADRKWEEGRA